MAASTPLRILPFAAGLVGLGVVTIVALTLRKVDVAGDTAFRTQLAQIERFDQRVEEDVLRARLGDLVQYDGLAETIRAQRAVASDLKAHARQLSEPRRARYEHALSALAYFLDRKEQAVYRFVRENAVLQNSFTYLATLSRELSRHASDGPARADELNSLQLLLRDALVYYRTGDAELGAAIDRRLADMQRKPELASDFGGVAGALVSHTALVRATWPAVNMLAREVRGARIDPLLAQVLDPHIAQIGTDNRSEANWRGVLVLIVAGLLLFLGVTVMRREQAVNELGEREQHAQRHSEVLELIARRAPFARVLERLCDGLGAETGGAASVLLVDESGAQLELAAAPAMEPAARDMLSRVPVREGAGAWGTAAARRAPVIVEDLATSALCAEYRALSDQLNYAACWAVPVLAADGALLGTLAIATRTAGRPDPARSATLSAYARLVAIAVEKFRAEQGLAEAKELAEVTLHSIGDAVVRADLDGRVTYMNPVAEELTGWQLTEARGRDVREVIVLVNEHDREPAENPVVRCLASRRVTALSGQALLQARGGREYAITDSAAPIRDSHGRMLGAILVFQDVSEERRLARAISHQARHDPLTGLLNRREFEGRLAEALVSAQADRREHVMGYVDLDQFKLVNDVCGHLAGDELLKQLTVLLVDCVRGADLLGRLGGDEFGILLLDCPMDKGIAIAENLRRSINDFRFAWDGRTFDIRASIGLVAVDATCDSVGEILKQADMACYTAKDTGRNRVHVYTPSDAELTRRQSELQWVASLREAVAGDRFQLYIQPIVALRSDAPDSAWHEVLLRMIDSEGRIVAPGAFVPAGERYNVMAAVDRWVIEHACARLQHGSSAGIDRLAINLSGDALNDADFLDFIRGTLANHRIEPARVCFELTETAAVANFNRARNLVSQLRELGCQCALDDFGSGLSSFAYLKNLPVNVLKIDGSFVRDMASDPTDHAMVAAINNVGHVLGIKTVAEFVESAETLNALRALGVDYGQGYALGRPFPMEDL